ncbi:metallophosphoesterase [Cohnella faecalis]|uniref:Metallophosphoesterase n=1 Tax=Cohnella faecalis TaxID=2315694 RepID=A0A398D0X7_9BACL|nr:metallophosphoesterase [Cohnella faecalis]RIE04824.1 metallophosphoesterase [Cohnella faecalis]
MKSRLNIRTIVFISALLLLLTALNVYIGWHGSVLLGTVVPAFPQAVYWPVFLLFSFGYLFGRLVPLPKPLKPTGRLLKVLGSYYIGILEMSVILLPLVDIAAWIGWANGADKDTFVSWAGGIVVGLLTIFLLVGSRNAWSTVTRTFDVRVDKKAGAIEKIRIAAASDLHLGNVVGNRHLGRLVERINAMEPDVILLPGDVLDDAIEPFVRNDMASVLGKLKARFGVYAVLGNHEYFGGDIEEYVKRMSDVGITVLRDEKAIVADSFVVAGRKDRSAEQMDSSGRLETRDLLADVESAMPIILMDHQPYQFDLAEAAGADVLLCGHTHRGQFAPNHWVTKRLFELDWGYLRKGALHVIVSSGYGTWGPPLRIASRSEVIRVNVEFAR